MKSTQTTTTVPPWVAQLANPESWQAWMQQGPLALPSIDPNALTNMLGQIGNQTVPAFNEIANSIDPAVATRLQQDYIESFAALVQDLAQSKIPALSDKRFKAPAWHSNGLYAFNAAAYLLNARFLMAMADAVKAPAKAKQKIRFAVQQMVDAMAPSNFLATNPEAQQKIIDTKGESLQKGITHMLADMKKGRISQTDESAFEVGKNVATTAGSVVFENDLFQLIQYEPLTKTVAERPLLIVPPCINKFYILDLQPDNSLVKYAIDEGNTVFLVSWRNPDASLGHLTWDDYVEQGVMQAIAVSQAISKQDKINALGFCVGGTLLSTALAVMAAQGEHPVSGLTLLTAFLDFSDTGVIDVFIDDMMVGMREQTNGGGGLIKGSEFTSTISSLRPNDLIWNYVGANDL